MSVAEVLSLTDTCCLRNEFKQADVFFEILVVKQEQDIVWQCTFNVAEEFHSGKKKVEGFSFKLCFIPFSLLQFCFAT